MFLSPGCNSVCPNYLGVAENESFYVRTQQTMFALNVVRASRNVFVKYSVAVEIINVHVYMPFLLLNRFKRLNQEIVVQRWMKH